MEITMIHDETIIEVSGTDGERFLLDFMANGSTVAQLMFDQSVVSLLEKRGAAYHSTLCARRDVAEQAKIVRLKVFKYAFRTLRYNRNAARIQKQLERKVKP